MISKEDLEKMRVSRQPTAEDIKYAKIKLEGKDITVEDLFNHYTSGYNSAIQSVLYLIEEKENGKTKHNQE